LVDGTTTITVDGTDSGMFDHETTTALLYVDT
jgi:hypothetical protein